MVWMVWCAASVDVENAGVYISFNVVAVGLLTHVLHFFLSFTCCTACHCMLVTLALPPFIRIFFSLPYV